MWQGSCGAAVAVVRDGEKLRRIVARLNLKRGEVDRRPVEAGRGPGLQSGEGEAGGLEALGERD